MNTNRSTLVTKVTNFRAALIRSRSLFLASLAVLLMATMGASQAHAADAKVYPGSMCVGHNTTGPFSTDFGAIRNVSGERVAVVCPVVRDHTDRGIANGWVRVIDARQPISICLLVRDNRSGGQWVHSVVGPSSRIPGGLEIDQQYNFSALPNPGATSHYYYYCEIPAGGSVTSYQVNENT